MKWGIDQNDWISGVEVDESEEVNYVNKDGRIINDRIGKTIFFTKSEAVLMCDKLNKKELK